MPRLNDLGQGKLEAPKLDPRDIIIRKGFNYRDTGSEVSQSHIGWLKESIRATGVQEPIRVEFIDGKVFLVNGECRLRACLELVKEGLDVRIPAIAVKGDEAEVLAASMVANGSLPPTKLEFGAAADRLLKYGWALEKITAYIPPHIGVKGSKAKRFVQEAVDLHHAPLAVKNAVKEGVDGVKLSESAALSIAKKDRTNADERIQEAVKDAKAKGETVAKRPKGAGEVTKKKQSFQAFNDKLLELADILAAAILNDNMAIGEVQKKARAYQKVRRAD